MVLKTWSKCSAKQVLQERLATNDQVCQAYEADLDEVHFKVLKKPTLAQHNQTLAHWSEYVASLRDQAVEISAEIVPGARLPTLSQMKGFVRWLAMHLTGQLAEYINKHTLQTYIHTFIACWPRYAVIPVPKEYRLQILAYSQSDALLNIASISTEAREKPLADVVDVNILIRAFWSDVRRFRTNCMRIQMAYTSEISAISSERPGALVESSAYRHSNECLLYEDHKVFIIPNPMNSHHPFVAIIVTLNLLKAKRDDKGVFCQFILFPEPNSRRASDPVMMFLSMALEDEVFEDLTVVEEITHPVHPVIQIHCLRYKKDKRKLPVLRAEVFADGKSYIISPTAALPYYVYTGHLRHFSTVAVELQYRRYICY